MSVEITFEPLGLSGLVAEGIYLSDAARRMGVSMPLDCKGSGQCVSCRVQIYSGAGLLAAPTEAERNILGLEGLSQQQRLACQVRIVSAGELRVYMNTEREKTEKEPIDAATMRKKFGELALGKKITTLMQLEALTMFEALNAVVDKPLALGEKLFDRFYSRAKEAKKQEKTGN